MLPLVPGTQTFEKEQRLTRSVTYWDTTQTTPERGISCALFDVLSPSYNLLAETTRAGIETSLKGANFRSVLGYTGTGAYETGVVSNLYLYWGAGSPTGGQTARRVAWKFSGTVTGAGASPQSTLLVFGGQGKIQVFHTRSGVVTKIKSGVVKEPLPRPNLTTLASVELEGGYQIVDASLQDGDVLEIYYVQNGEPWGGFFAKAIPGSSSQFLTGSLWDWPAFRSSLEEAAFVGPSLLSVGAASPRTLDYLEKAVVHGQVSATSTLELEFPLARPGDPNGYILSESAGQIQLVHAVTDEVIRPHRRVHFEAGFKGSQTEVYPRFTGLIEKITPGDDLKTAVAHCQSFEIRTEKQFDENYPDLVSYHAHGFIDREWKGLPVWGAPCYDAWPLEAALADLLSRVGVDSYNLGRSPFTTSPSYGRWEFAKATSGEVVSTHPKFRCRSLSNPEERVYLQRKGNYGNFGVLKKDYLPNDDPYLYPSELSDRLLDRVIHLADQYGYDVYFDAEGQAVIAARNNNSEFRYVSTSGVDEEVSPSAVGGRYLSHQDTDAAWTAQLSGLMSRLDLFTGIGKSGTLNGGLIGVSVEVKSGANWVAVPSASRTISTYSDSAEAFFYDYATRTDGTNAAVFTVLQLPFDEYRVTLSPLGPDAEDVGASNCLYRINGAALFDRDPMATPYPVHLSPLKNALEIHPESLEDDQRNKVIVVGARKAAVTDSQKLGESENPNNPLPEFFVQVSADPASVYQEAAENFVGATRSALLIDDKVTDGDYAAWLSRYLLYRTRAPKLSGRLSHTPIPVLEIRDPFRIELPSAPDSYPHLLWVHEFTESWGTGEATVDIHFTSEPEIPSYTPREDVDLAQFGGVPVLNLSISYENLYGTRVDESDLALSAVHLTTLTPTTLTATAGPQTLAAGAIPETVCLVKSVTGGKVEPKVNHPYQHFYHVIGWSGLAPTLEYDFQAGDGTAGVYDKTYHGFPSGTGTTWSVQYEALGARTGTNPFYDPYTSELGNLVSIQFDALVSGFYRVSLWASPEKGTLDFPVAWLTAPEGDPLNEDAHWTYLESGAGKEWLWDGVDNVGIYNRTQSQSLARLLKGAFGDLPTAVGAGFYVWNDPTSELHTQIGDLVAGNLGTFTCPLTGASETRFHYSIGKYAKFYVKVEVRSDVVLRSTGDTTPLELNTEKKVLDASGRTAKNPNGAEDPVYIWTHLGEPTQVWVDAYEWNPTKNAAGDWTETNAADGWEKLSSNPSAHPNAPISEVKPTKLIFSMVPRPGPAFVGETDHQSVQLRPQVHLKATLFDQFWTFYSHPWEDVHPDNIPTKNPKNTEEKRVTSRMYHNDAHTIEYASEAWRSGEDLASYEFVFEPSQFKKDFGLGVVEELRYNDFEQLETIPGHDPQSGSGAPRTDRAYLTYAYINYLFYLSAHTLDRSGRRQWCLNPAFLDTSKIVASSWTSPAAGKLPYYRCHYETLGAERYLNRSVFARQWVDARWKAGTYANSPVDRYSITDAHELEFVQLEARDFSPHRSTLADSAVRADRKDPWLDAYASPGSDVNDEMLVPVGTASLVSVPSRYLLPTGFGSWTFSQGNAFQAEFLPCPSRDFHPYWSRVMPDWIERVPGDNFDDVSVLAATTADVLDPARVGNFDSKVGFRDVLGQENWFGTAVTQSGIGGSFLGQGALLEVSTQTLLKAVRFGPIDTLFDYVRQDTLDRFDQFRGVFSRAPLGSRKKDGPTWFESDQQRAASSQVVSANGSAYLLNVGHYADYVVGPIHKSQRTQVIHQTSGVSDFFDLRFRYETVWQNDQYYPTWAGGGSTYWRFREEYTRIPARIPVLQELEATGLAYDAGAWTGFKDDIDSTAWSSNPRLRWGEIVAYPYPVAGSFAFVRGGNDDGTYSLQGTSLPYYRANFFEGAFSVNYGTQPRLAVGPELPETARLVMNLALPERLAV